MDSLNILLEDKLSIKDKINKAMNELKDWFHNKMDTFKDFFREINLKCIDIKNMIYKILGIEKSIIDVNIRYGDKILYRKGTPTNNLMSDIDKILNDLRKETDNIVKDCKEGIRSITRNDKDKAIDIHYSVSDRIKKSIFLGSVMVSSITAILFSQSRKISKDRERQYQDVIKRDRNNFKQKESELKSEIENLSNIISKMRSDDDNDNNMIIISN